MFKKINVIAMTFFFTVCAFADSDALQAYIQDFYDGEDNAAKVNILQKALSDNAVNESAGELFEYALQYALADSVNAESYNDLNRIILASLYGLRKAKNAENLELLWRLFLEYPVPEVKSEIMIFLGSFGKENEIIIDNINNYLFDTNALYISGKSVDYLIISSSIAALMELDHVSSYPVLLDVLRAGYPEVIALEATGALDFMSGNLIMFLRDSIERGLPGEKLAALRAGIFSGRLSVAERGTLAELALELTLDAGEEDVYLSAMRYLAVSILTELRWTKANDLAVRYYYMTMAEFQKNAGYKNRLIEAIVFLGAVGNSEAALALGLQLGLINTQRERTGYFDAGITLAIVQALGQIGDNAAYNYLLRASTLSYNENITSASREAMNRLKW